MTVLEKRRPKVLTKQPATTRAVGRCVLVRFHPEPHEKMEGCVGWEESK